VISEVAGRPVGAAWYRTFPMSEPGDGFFAEDIPAVAIAVTTNAHHSS
jgi:hypothetical protein